MNTSFRKEAIQNGGFYSDDGVWNSIITLPNDNRLYRKRVETLIIQGKSVFVKRKPNGEYFLPGGSTEKDVPDIEQAVNECREEARMKVKNIKFTGITYKSYLPKNKEYMKDLPIKWDGMITDIYVSEYDGMDKNQVDKKDLDPFIKSGRFYTFKECYKMFREEHKTALYQYTKELKEQNSTVEESYITNYFANKKYLKSIGKEPEFDDNTINQILDICIREYQKGLQKSSIKKEMKNPDANTIFHPVLTFDFPSGDTIALCISYGEDGTNPGCAVHTEEYGDIVILYRTYFNLNKEAKKYVLLHEIGHIRLHHIDPRNLHRKYFGVFGDIDVNDHRLKLARKANTVYEEINADLYAVLSGAKMYSILGITNKKDYDKNYDYRVTNAELANRYRSVYRMYDKYKKYVESGEEMFNLPEYNDKDITFEFTMYDFVCLSIHDFVYSENALSSSEKKKLYSILYEYVIGSKVPKSKELTNRLNDMNRLIKESPSMVDKDQLSFLKKEKIYRDRALFNKDNSITIENTINSNIPTLDEFIQYRDYANNLLYESISDLYESLNYSITLDICSGKQNSIAENIKYLIEEATKRSELPDSVSGTSDRRYPLDTREHVYSAIRLFGHVDKAHEEELAKNIIKAMKKYHIPKSAVGPKNRLQKYL